MKISDIRGQLDAESRIFHTNLRFAGLNNARYTDLLPRLRRVDDLALTCSARRYVRAVQFRVLNATMRVHGRQLFRMASRSYRHGFVTNITHVPLAPFPIVVDMDDPVFTGDEVDLLSSAHVAAVVVTNDRAAERYRDLGLRAPVRVIGQGIDLASMAHDAVAGILQRKRPGELTVGYVAAWHLAGRDRGGGAVYDVEHLVDELWPAVRAECPRARLWLVGGIGDGLRRKAGRMPDVELVGPVPQSRVPAYMSVFDAAVYPRRIQHDRASVKVAQYIGAGVPVVGYRATPTEPIGRSGAGILVESPGEFVAALTRVLGDAGLRRRLSANARAASAEVDWDQLGERYNDLLDEFLPRVG